MEILFASKILAEGIGILGVGFVLEACLPWMLCWKQSC
jgi:hypothetical protein